MKYYDIPDLFSRWIKAQSSVNAELHGSREQWELVRDAIGFWSIMEVPAHCKVELPRELNTYGIYCWPSEFEIDTMGPMFWASLDEMRFTLDGQPFTIEKMKEEAL